MGNCSFECSPLVCVCVCACKACNIMSQSPEGSFTMVIPHERRNCSFSIIYPVEIRLTELSLGQAKSNDIRLQVRWSGESKLSERFSSNWTWLTGSAVGVSQRQVWSDCSGSGDYVELLGGDGVDTSQMFPVADLCFSLSGLGQSFSRWVNGFGFNFLLSPLF